MPTYNPIFLNLQGRKCLIVGGGQVAQRKVGMLLESEAEVTVVSPRICAGLRKLADDGRIDVISRTFHPADMKDINIAVIATSKRAINLAAAGEARKRGVSVNVADNPALSDFIFPSVMRRGSLAIAVSTSGKSPALARKIRHKLESEFGQEYASLVLIIEEARRQVKKQGLKISGAHWQESLDLDSMIALIRRGRGDRAREVLVNKLKKCGK